ncbi:MAG: redoxin domain-containing protein [Acidimicrobiia bacterium]
MPAEIGAPTPDFTLRNYDRTTLSRSDLLGSSALVVFIPFAFTRTCTAELCDLRDNLGTLQQGGSKVVVITCDSMGTNRAWAESEGVTYPVLSDFWPHGEVSTAYGCFNEKLGVPNRTTYVLDADGIVRDIIESESFGTARDVGSYTRALASL